MVRTIEPNDTIGGFQVESLLGKGGMASVYRAIQVRLQRPVALKVLNPALAADESFVQRFQIEGVNAARLDHLHIVPVYEAGEDDGHVYLAMKLIEGETLGSVINRLRSVPPDETARILTDVARALDYAHGLGFVHRDVKPGNVLIDRTGHVFLSDFGLSKDTATKGITATGQWMGTAEYMAPEQAAGKELDHRADLYALGCVAFECLVGAPPYEAENHFAVIMSHANAEIPSAVERNNALHANVDLVLRRAMAKDPAQRYSTAVELAEALSGALEGAPTDAPPEPAPAQPQPRFPVSVPPAPAAPAAGPEMVCSNCLGMVEREDLFCGGCGMRVLWCHVCSGPRSESDRFCPHCGAVSAPPGSR